HQFHKRYFGSFKGTLKQKRNFKRPYLSRNTSTVMLEELLFQGKMNPDLGNSEEVYSLTYAYKEGLKLVQNYYYDVSLHGSVFIPIFIPQ
ncbi:hypothetical protein VP01_8543g1, partial [Puccinia sorghi]